MVLMKWYIVSAIARVARKVSLGWFGGIKEEKQSKLFKIYKIGVSEQSDIHENISPHSPILASVSSKFPGFCKCLRFSKFGFATFSNSAGHQK